MDTRDGIPDAADAAGAGWLRTNSSLDVVHLSQTLMGLFADAARTSRRIVLVTPPHSRLTFATAEFLLLLDGVWLTADDQGRLSSAATGEPVRDEADAFTVRSSALRPVPGSEWGLQVNVSVQHPARSETVLGLTAETLGSMLGGGAPDSWGAAEPTTMRWDRRGYTELARRRMPADTRLFFAGGAADRGFSGTLRVSRSAQGVVEETKMLVADGAGAKAAPIGAIAALKSLAAAQRVLFGTVWAVDGTDRDTFCAGPHDVPLPIAAVIGARTLRSEQIDPSAFDEVASTHRAGPSRAPSIVVEFTGEPADRWEQLRGAAVASGVPRLLDAVSRSGRGGVDD